VFTDIINNYGADSYVGRIASTIMGSTETIFYTLTVYFGAVGIKKIRHTLWAAIIADLTAIVMAVIVVTFIFY
jgi:spore maturation protein B